MNDEIVILIVDDIEVNRVILKGIFEQDYKVIEADDGTTALDILNRGTKVDIILLDIIMPVMNGIDFLKEIKKNIGSDIVISDLKVLIIVLNSI